MSWFGIKKPSIVVSIWEDEGCFLMYMHILSNVVSSFGASPEFQGIYSAILELEAEQSNEWNWYSTPFQTIFSF